MPKLIVACVPNQTSYAGLHCVVIKGYSKSAGYQPGMRFDDGRFRNSWNAVYVAGGWRFVQCNWGARHLVNAREVPRPGDRGRADALRYEYDDHYFLTDPHEFIFEFFPLNSEWQLLTQPLTLNEFEQLPFVRSLFFRYGLYFAAADQDEDTSIGINDNSSSSGSSSGVGSSNARSGGAHDTTYELPDSSGGSSVTGAVGPSHPYHTDRWHPSAVLRACQAVLHTDRSGAATVRIGMPTRLAPALIFHYNLRFYGRDGPDEHEGVSLRRFVLQSASNNVVRFRVHAPVAGQFVLDVFANATSARRYVAGEPIKFKSVCKLRLLANDLRTAMLPLPACASGEWGPLKATRLFGLIALTHPHALITSDSHTLELQFRMSRPLGDFLASVHRNGVDDSRLARCVSVRVSNDIVSFSLRLPADGQYGLDIYTREPGPAHGDKQLLTHCCKYLINVALK
jgi:hypothetical protein